MKKLSKVMIVLLMLFAVTACKGNTPEDKYAEEAQEVKEDYDEAAREDNPVKAARKELKAYIKEKELEAATQNFNDVMKQIEDGGIETIKSIVNQVSDVFTKLTNDEEVAVDKVLATYGVASAVAVLEDEYENEPVLKLCEKFKDYIEHTIEGEDTTKEEFDINGYIEYLSFYSDEEYTKIYEKIINR